jgi:hypothetical protein
MSTIRTFAPRTTLDQPKAWKQTELSSACGQMRKTSVISHTLSPMKTRLSEKYLHTPIKNWSSTHLLPLLLLYRCLEPHPQCCPSSSRPFQHPWLYVHYPPLPIPIRMAVLHPRRQLPSPNDSKKWYTSTPTASSSHSSTDEEELLVQETPPDHCAIIIHPSLCRSLTQWDLPHHPLLPNSRNRLLHQ